MPRVPEGIGMTSRCLGRGVDFMWTRSVVCVAPDVMSLCSKKGREAALPGLAEGEIISAGNWFRGRVVRQRSAKPPTAVQIRPEPLSCLPRQIPAGLPFFRSSLLLMFTLGCLDLSGQSFLQTEFVDRHYTLRLGGGTTGYLGDLPFHLKSTLSYVSIAGEIRLWSHVGAGVEGGYMVLSGADREASLGSFERQRNLSFSSRVSELSVKIVYYPIAFPSYYYKRPGVDPYISFGAGLLHFSPRTLFGGISYNLRDLAVEGERYRGFGLILPGAVGLRFRLTRTINLITEFAYRYCFSDYLDDVSGNFPLEDDNLLISLLANRRDEVPLTNSQAYDSMVPGTPRGDNRGGDHYFMAGLHLEWYVGTTRKRDRKKE